MVKKKKRKYKDQMMGMVGSSLLGAGSSVALGGLNNPNAVHGQQGISNVTGFFPAMGTMYGTGMLLDTVNQLEPKPRRKVKKRRYRR